MFPTCSLGATVATVDIKNTQYTTHTHTHPFAHDRAHSVGNDRRQLLKRGAIHDDHSNKKSKRERERDEHSRETDAKAETSTSHRADRLGEAQREGAEKQAGIRGRPTCWAASFEGEHFCCGYLSVPSLVKFGQVLGATRTWPCGYASLGATISTH